MTLPKKDENLFFSVFPSSLMMNCCDYIIIIINTYDMIIYTMIKNEIYLFIVLLIHAYSNLGNSPLRHSDSKGF